MKEQKPFMQAARRRRKQIMALRKRNWTYARIGAKYGISTQRAAKIVKEENDRNLQKVVLNLPRNKR